MKVVCNINTKIFDFTEGKIYEVITAPHDYFFAKDQQCYNKYSKLHRNRSPLTEEANLILIQQYP
jgi:hypothetical protein